MNTNLDQFANDKIQMEAIGHEVQLLGSMIYGSEYIEQIATIVDADDFRDADHGKLFHAFMTLHQAEKPLHDVALLRAELLRMKADENICTAYYLGKIMSSVANAGHIIYHAEHVRYASHKRKLAKLAYKAMQLSQDYDCDEQHDITAMERELSILANSITDTRGAKTVEGVANELVNEIEKRSQVNHNHKPGIFTGLYSHDSTTGPLMPGELCILAARPGCGKTALAMQWATHVATKGKRTLFISLEMKDRELVGRMLAAISEVESSVIRAQQADSEQIGRLRVAAGSLHGLPLIVWDQSRATIKNIVGIAKHTQATGGIEALFVDYLGLIRSDGSKRGIPRHEQIAEITGELKATAKELEIPIVCLCQLNREADGQTPILSHLRESGAIEQDADMVIFIHHEKDDNRYAETKQASVIVAKNRHGAIGTSKLFWTPSKTLFSEGAEWNP